MKQTLSLYHLEMTGIADVFDKSVTDTAVKMLTLFPLSKNRLEVQTLPASRLWYSWRAIEKSGCHHDL